MSEENKKTNKSTIKSSKTENSNWEKKFKLITEEWAKLLASFSVWIMMATIGVSYAYQWTIQHAFQSIKETKIESYARVIENENSHSNLNYGIEDYQAFLLHSNYAIPNPPPLPEEQTPTPPNLPPSSSPCQSSWLEWESSEYRGLVCEWKTPNKYNWDIVNIDDWQCWNAYFKCINGKWKQL